MIRGAHHGTTRTLSVSLDSKRSTYCYATLWLVTRNGSSFHDDAHLASPRANIVAVGNGLGIVVDDVVEVVLDASLLQKDRVHHYHDDRQQVKVGGNLLVRKTMRD
jgi:hypothetical protein